MKKLLLLIILLLPFSVLQAHQGSVVCLHGFFRSYKCMIPLGNTFRKEGLDVYLWDYQSRRETIESHAANLVQVLNEIAKKKPGEPIHFTTHSFGGIIVRAAVNHPDCPPEAKMGKAVLMAPPNQGEQLAHNFKHCPAARWMFGKKAGHQLLTYDHESMASVGEFPESMEVMVIAGTKGSRFYNLWIQEPNDGKVSVDETRLNTPHIHYVFDVSHNWIMTSRQSIAVTRSFILEE